jgi:hypothetical protein
MNRMLLRAISVACANLCGCSGQSITPDRIAAIPTFSVDEQVPLPSLPAYFGRPQIWGRAIGGVLGWEISQSGEENVPTRIKAYLDQQHIDVQQIVRTDFRMDSPPIHDSPTGSSTTARRTSS